MERKESEEHLKGLLILDLIAHEVGVLVARAAHEYPLLIFIFSLNICVSIEILTPIWLSRSSATAIVEDPEASIRKNGKFETCLHLIDQPLMPLIIQGLGVYQACQDGKFTCTWKEFPDISHVMGGPPLNKLYSIMLTIYSCTKQAEARAYHDRLSSFVSPLTNNILLFASLVSFIFGPCIGFFDCYYDMKHHMLATQLFTGGEIVYIYGLVYLIATNRNQFPASAGTAINLSILMLTSETLVTNKNTDQLCRGLIPEVFLALYSTPKIQISYKYRGRESLLWQQCLDDRVRDGECLDLFNQYLFEMHYFCLQLCQPSLLSMDTACSSLALRAQAFQSIRSVSGLLSMATSSSVSNSPHSSDKFNKKDKYNR